MLPSHIQDWFDLTGKTVVITGGYKGLGAMLSTTLNAAGARIISLARNHDQNHKFCSNLSHDAIAYECDISNPQSIVDTTTKIHNEIKNIDILIHCAGHVYLSHLGDISIQEWQYDLDINLTGPFLLTQQLLPIFKTKTTKSTKNKIIFIGAADHFTPSENPTFAYIAAKAAITRITSHLAKTLAADNINVNCIAPGPFPTDFNENARLYPEETGTFVPAGRVGKESDIGAAILYLCGQSGDFVTGSTLHVDGGIAGCGLNL